MTIWNEIKKHSNSIMVLEKEDRKNISKLHQLHSKQIFSCDKENIYEYKEK